MTDNQLDNVIQDDGTSNNEAVPFSVGLTLREARLQRGLTVGDVSHHIKFAHRQIESLEADDFEHLPETAFLRGFVRSYARLLQIDSTPLLTALPHAPEQPIPQEVKVQTESLGQNVFTVIKQNIIWLAAAFFIAIVLVLIVWQLGDNRKEQNVPKVALSDTQNTPMETLVQPSAVPISTVNEAQPTSAVPITPPLPILPNSDKPVDALPNATEVKNIAPLPPSLAQTPVPPIISPVIIPAVSNNILGQAALHMTFDNDSWVEITDKNGKRLSSQLNRTGSELTVNGTPPFSLLIGNATGVHLLYKGQPVDLSSHTKVNIARLRLE